MHGISYAYGCETDRIFNELSSLEEKKRQKKKCSKQIVWVASLKFFSIRNGPLCAVFLSSQTLQAQSQSQLYIYAIIFSFFSFFLHFVGVVVAAVVVISWSVGWLTGRSTKQHIPSDYDWNKEEKKKIIFQTTLQTSAGNWYCSDRKALWLWRKQFSVSDRLYKLLDPFGCIWVHRTAKAFTVNPLTVSAIFASQIWIIIHSLCADAVLATRCNCCVGTVWRTRETFWINEFAN